MVKIAEKEWNIYYKNDEIYQKTGNTLEISSSFHKQNHQSSVVITWISEIEFIKYLTYIFRDIIKRRPEMFNIMFEFLVNKLFIALFCFIFIILENIIVIKVFITPYFQKKY